MIHDEKLINSDIVGDIFKAPYKKKYHVYYKNFRVAGVKKCNFSEWAGMAVPC